MRVVSDNGATVAGRVHRRERTILVERPTFRRRAVSKLRWPDFRRRRCRARRTSSAITLAVAPVRETVIVSATRTDAPTSQVGASATVYTAGDLERLQKPLLADLLVATPGAMLIRNGGPGTVTSLFVRGGESDYNKILLDGVPLNEPGGTFYLSNLTTENLDRIEVVRGAYSSLFGSDAMASVIQLFTKRPQGGSTRPQVSAQIDGGTYGTLHTTAAVSGARQRLDYSLGAARLDSDNRVPNSALENTTLSANVGVALAPETSLRFIARGEREHVGTPGTTAYGRPDLDAFFSGTMESAVCSSTSRSMDGSTSAPGIHWPRPISSRPTSWPIRPIRPCSKGKSGSSRRATSSTTAATTFAGTTPPIRRICTCRPPRRSATTH